MKKFDTYIHKKSKIIEEHNVYQMYVQYNGTGSWIFKGLVSENAKNIIQSDDTVDELNSKYEEQVILSTFTKKPIEETSKTYLFIPCKNADVSTFSPTFKDENND